MKITCGQPRDQLSIILYKKLDIITTIKVKIEMGWARNVIE